MTPQTGWAIMRKGRVRSEFVYQQYLVFRTRHQAEQHRAIGESVQRVEIRVVGREHE